MQHNCIPRAKGDILSNTLIVMRHGKAERPEEGVDDKDRQLSAYGARALRATCKQSLKQMRKNATVNIWSSPALRAMQTAEIVFDACKQAGIQVIGELESVDALWDCDFDAFIEHVRSCSADVVFAVGHNPFIEEVVEQLTGSRITFATGSIATSAPLWINLASWIVAAVVMSLFCSRGNRVLGFIGALIAGAILIVAAFACTWAASAGQLVMPDALDLLRAIIPLAVGGVLCIYGVPERHS